jgi:hypothetical protein
MIKKFNFEEVVRAMSAKEIIMAMVEGLKNPITEIDMDTYGRIARHDESVCYGDAAANTICHIAGVTTQEFINGLQGHHNESYGEVNREFLESFELAIDYLRTGDIDTYNALARPINIAFIYNPCGIELEPLYNDYTEEDLEAYVKLAQTQENA